MGDTDILLEKNDDGELDMVFEDGEFKMCEDGEACTVAIVENLLLTRVEAIGSPIVNTNSDPFAGTNWYGIILNDTLDPAMGELELKRVIFGTTGVTSIQEWNVQRVDRTLTIFARIMTIWGEVTLGDTLGI